jgi:alpha-D-ribose 1-methylphosphonate 5-triphosphate synthase subunit PhnH
MSALVAAKLYDEVFDGQKHYRTLLDCTARPGTIGQLDDVLLDVPPHYNHATALIVLGLFGGDTTYYLGHDGDQPSAQQRGDECDFVRRNTGAKPAPASQADFLLLFKSNLLEKLDDVRVGSLPFPDMGATAVVQVEGVSPAPMPGSLRLKLTGPGIESETVVFVMGVPESFFEKRRELNVELPMGLDVFLTCDSLSAGPCVLALPRTTRVDWERI